MPRYSFCSTLGKEYTQIRYRPCFGNFLRSLAGSRSAQHDQVRQAPTQMISVHIVIIILINSLINKGKPKSAASTLLFLRIFRFFVIQFNVLFSNWLFRWFNRLIHFWFVHRLLLIRVFGILLRSCCG